MTSPLSVLRICSVFEPPRDLELSRAAAFDPVGGMQNHVAALSRALDAKGVAQVVVTTRPPGAPARHAFGGRGLIVRVGWPLARLRQLFCVAAVAPVLRPGHRVDVVHAHLGEDLAIVPLAVVAARVHRAPLVVTVHCSLAHTLVGTDLRSFTLRTLGARLERAGTRRADAVITLTDRTARAARDDAATGAVHVIPSGLEPSLFAGPFADPLPAVPRPRVLFVGRLARQKRVGRLIDAIERVPGAQLVLVGDGPERAAVERRIAVRRLGDRTTITGFVHHRDVPAYLAHADVLVLPSVYEELGSVLLEAMAAGVPVVATATPGVASVVRDGDNGVLWGGDDAGSLAAIIRRVIADASLRQRLIRGGRATAASYDWERLGSGVLAVYERVTGGAPARRGAAPVVAASGAP